jgi:hypothetical protein
MSGFPGKTYIILILVLVSGYIWLIYELAVNPSGSDTGMGVCLFRHVTGIPCPSCGSTRSVLSLLHGNIADALELNPLGIVIAFIMAVLPLWIIIDIIFRKKTLYEFYSLAERWLRRPAIAVPLILLLLINWIWNIGKAL